MGRLSYPVLHGSRYRWSQTNTTNNEDMKPAMPCLRNTCDGHGSEYSAALHHAMWFCTQAGITWRADVDQKRCVVCNTFTIHRVAFINCPYEDYLPHCLDHDPRITLRRNHMKRRELTDTYAHVQNTPAGMRVVNPVAEFDQLIEDANAQAQASA
jgi:hypothetical protein